MKRLGVTGPIGSGKSTVVSLFELMGVPCYNCDRRAKELMATLLVDDIVALFGPEAYADGSLRRAFVADKIFSDEALKESLEQIVHPAVTLDFEHWVDGKVADFVVVESAILIQSPLVDHVDKVLVVSAPFDLRMARVMARDGCTLAQAKARDAAQMDRNILRQYADFEIITDENRLLSDKVIAIYEKMTNFVRL